MDPQNPLSIADNLGEEVAEPIVALQFDLRKGDRIYMIDRIQSQKDVGRSHKSCTHMQAVFLARQSRTKALEDALKAHNLGVLPQVQATAAAKPYEKPRGLYDSAIPATCIGFGTNHIPKVVRKEQACGRVGRASPPSQVPSN